jgi:Fe-S-cluster containining protein
MDIHFNCTQCGKCCRDCKIPLTVPEAIKWLHRGHQVQVLCEASPWPVSIADDDPKAAHFRRRSFAAMSGSMPIRVVAMLAANLIGRCPNLLADMRCGIYEDRPLVCRIYPAEVNPAVVLRRENKACPPEAWTDDRALLQHDGILISEVITRDVQSLREADAREARLKSRVCAALKVIDAALVHEAVLVYSPSADLLLSALGSAMANDDDTAQTQWRFISDRREIVDDLSRLGAVARHFTDDRPVAYQHVGFMREPLFGPYAH